MLLLEDICKELQGRLSDAEGKCQQYLADAVTFDGFVDSNVTDVLGSKLATLRDWVAVQTKVMHREYFSRIYVFALLRESDGLTLDWALSKQGISRTFWLDNPNVEVLSEKEALALLDELRKEVGTGNYARAIDWLRRYWRSPGLNLGES